MLLFQKSIVVSLEVPKYIMSDDSRSVFNGWGHGGAGVGTAGVTVV